MKRFLTTHGNIILAFVFIAAFSLNAVSQDNKKHIKVVTVIDGEKAELDTVIDNGTVLIWNGDTISKGNETIVKANSEADFDIDVIEGAEGKVVVMKSGENTAPGSYTYKINGDSLSVVTFEALGDSDFDKDINVKVIGFNDDEMKMHHHRNVIDLSDPGIISYEKKELKNGTEKITIVRKKPVERLPEANEQVIIMRSGDWMPKQAKHKGRVKTIKVVSGDDGNMKIYENGKVMHYKEGKKEGEFISDDGKRIRIKKTKSKKGNAMQLKVEVEEEK